MNMIESRQLTAKDTDERRRLGRIEITKDAFRFVYGQELNLEDTRAELYAELFGEAFEFLSNRLIDCEKGA